MEKLPVLIADGDKASQQIICGYLEEASDFFIKKICSNGYDALASIEELKPALVFLDVDLPGKDGFKVLQELKEMPPVIFTTTQEKYAAKAFACNAVDYILKPYAKSRVEQALCRFGKWHQMDQVNAVEQNYLGPPVYPDKILIEKGKRFVSLAVDEITHMKAERAFTRIFMSNAEMYLSSYGISQIEKKMDPRKFIRVHRSHLINKSYIKELYRDISKLFVTLPNNVEICVGRNYFPVIKELIF